MDFRWLRGGQVGHREAVFILNPEVQVKIKRLYRRWATPYELLREVAKLKDDLRPGITAAQLKAQAAAQSDTEAALAMQQAKRELFRRIGRKIA